MWYVGLGIHVNLRALVKESYVVCRSGNSCEPESTSERIICGM